MNIFGTLRAQVRRRLLFSYRVDPVVARTLIPEPLRPQLVDGSAVAGLCVIGLTDVRPGWLRPKVGLRTENLAHRIAVEWDEGGETHTGVYVLERHSSALLPVLLGGRLFPGFQKRARFALDETATRYRVRATGDDVSIDVDVELTDRWESSLFPDVAAASEFYKSGAVGWSPRRDGTVEPLELSSEGWLASPGLVHHVESSFLDALPAGAATLDSVLVMRDIPSVWEVPHITIDDRRPLAPAG
ncbi:MAG: DUF2071 domain-containing protein [Pseudolysinimonas sp.]